MSKKDPELDIIAWKFANDRYSDYRPGLETLSRMKGSVESYKAGFKKAIELLKSEEFEKIAIDRYGDVLDYLEKFAGEK